MSGDAGATVGNGEPIEPDPRLGVDTPEVATSPGETMPQPVAPQSVQISAHQPPQSVQIPGQQPPPPVILDRWSIFDWRETVIALVVVAVIVLVVASVTAVRVNNVFSNTIGPVIFSNIPNGLSN